MSFSTSSMRRSKVESLVSFDMTEWEVVVVARQGRGPRLQTKSNLYALRHMLSRPQLTPDGDLEKFRGG